MNVSEIAVTNAANLSLFMVNVSQRLLGDLRPTNPDCSVLDLKALCRGVSTSPKPSKSFRQSLSQRYSRPEP